MNPIILVVDDEEYLRRMVIRIMTENGFVCDQAANGREALDALNTQQYALIISDITMPEMSGLELLAAARQVQPDVAIIMLTGMDSQQTAVQALELGAYGYLIKPFQANALLINVASALRRRDLEMMRNEYEQRLEREVIERTMDIRRREEQIIMHLVSASEYRDGNTGSHIRRVALYSAALAWEVGWIEDDVELLRLSAPMHDIGKIGVPDNILLKPDRLTVEEFDIMKQHTVMGANILSGSDIPLLRMASEVALSHHERWDGAGYPYGLSGDDIPECARIVAMADVYDALRSHRVYRPAFSESDTFTMMTEEEGDHYDPRLISCLIDLRKAFQEIYRHHPS